MLWFPEKRLKELAAEFPNAVINHLSARRAKPRQSHPSPPARFAGESLGYALNPEADFVILFEFRVRHSGKFWSTVTMATSDLREEERASPASATARCRPEDPASPGAEVGCGVLAAARASGVGHRGPPGGDTLTGAFGV